MIRFLPSPTLDCTRPRLRIALRDPISWLALAFLGGLLAEIPMLAARMAAAGM